MVFLAVILLTCAVNLGCSVTVELYSGQNYSGLLKRLIVKEMDEKSCIQLDPSYEVRSLKTDKCVILYETMDCKRIGTKLAEGSAMYSVRVEKDTALFDIDGAYSNRQEERGVQSFHLCGNEPGSGLLNVDIYSGPSYTGDLVASYEGVCKCTNIPGYITLKGKPFSIDNHGKNMYFYDKEDCTGQERFIPAGDNERSRSVFHLDTRAVVIRSFRPAGLPCPNLEASVYKFTFHPGTPTNQTHMAKQISTRTMTNREPTSVEEYVDLDVWDSVEYTVAKAFTDIHTSRVKAGVLMESQDLIPTELVRTLLSSFEAHYQYPDTNQNTPTIVARQRWGKRSEFPFDKPPCATCTVNIYLKKLQRVPISYTAEAIVTGMAGDDKVSAEQIRHFLPPGMKYVKDYNDYSVVVTVQGEVKGSFGNFYDRERSCEPLPDCSRVEL